VDTGVELGDGVGLGSGVGVDVGVGGMAAWVSADMVAASALAVANTLAESIVAGACGPHAAMKSEVMTSTSSGAFMLRTLHSL
jgi:hypothetical protein